MSRSFAVRGSHSRQVRNTLGNDMATGNANSEEDLQNGAESQGPSGNEPSQRVQRREAYTVIRPDEKKRNQLLQVANKETEEANRRKEAKRSTPVKMSPRCVGGGEMSQEQAILLLQKEAERKTRTRAIEMREKRERYAKEKKEKEDREIQEKKAAARVQAEKNDKKGALSHEKMRRANVDFFERKFAVDSCRSGSPPQGRERQREGYYTSSSSSAVESRPQPTGDDSLVELCRLYPDAEPGILADLLKASGGSIEKARSLLE